MHDQPTPPSTNLPQTIEALRITYARIIDPNAWDDGQFAEPGGRGQLFAQCASLAKADQILALTTPTGMDETQARELLAFTMASRGCKPENVEAVRHACNGHIVKVSADLAAAAIQAALSKGSVRQ